MKTGIAVGVAAVVVLVAGSHGVQELVADHLERQAFPAEWTVVRRVSRQIQFQAGE